MSATAVFYITQTVVGGIQDTPGEDNKYRLTSKVYNEFQTYIFCEILYMG